VAGAADASTVVYDSSSLYQAGTTGPEGGLVGHFTQSYAGGGPTYEAGGLIQLAGSDRLAQSATVQMRVGSGPNLDPVNGPFVQAGTVELTLNFYAVNGDRTFGSLLGSRTQRFDTPAGTAGNFATAAPYFDVTFNLSSLSLMLPDKVYFGVASFYNEFANAVAPSVNLSMWNYGTNPGGFAFWQGNGTAPDWVDWVDGPPGTPAGGSAVKVGTDLITGTWARGAFGSGGSEYTFDGTDPAYTGLTPNITITAVPEPSTYAMSLAGLACGGYLVRQRRRRA